MKLKHHSKHRSYNNTTKQKINKDITAQEVLIINTDGSTIGPCALNVALQMAEDQQLDLVEVAPNNVPPVCKILDYGKLKYSQNKKTRAKVRKKQIMKEIRMQPKISDHDLIFKTNHIQEFLENKNQVKITIRFKGRELAHPEIGKEKLEKILTLLTCSYSIDKPPAMEGRSMSMLLFPSSKKQHAATKTTPPEKKPEVSAEATTTPPPSNNTNIVDTG